MVILVYRMLNKIHRIFSVSVLVSDTFITSWPSNYEYNAVSPPCNKIRVLGNGLYLRYVLNAGSAD